MDVIVERGAGLDVHKGTVANLPDDDKRSFPSQRMAERKSGMQLWSGDRSIFRGKK